MNLKTPEYDFSKVVLITITGSTGFFTWGYTNSISNSILPFMSQSLFPEKTTSELSLIASILSIGAAFGAFFGSKIADRFGRRYSLLTADFIFFFGILLTMIANFELIVLGRILQGIIIGIYSTVGPMYLIEMSPKSVRGITGTLNFFVLNLANCTAFLMGLWFPNIDVPDPGSQIWRWTFGLCSVPLIVRIVILTWYLPSETPFYLIMNHKEEEAKDVLGMISNSKENVQTTFLELVQDRQMQQQKNENIGIRDLFSRKFRNAFLTGIIVSLLFQLSGLSAMMVFPDMVFQAGLDPSSKLGSIMSIIMGVVNIFSKLVATFSVQRFGRRPPLVYGLFVTAALMFLYSLIVWVDSTGNMMAKIIMMIWPLPFSVTVGGIAVLYVSEILPGVGISVCLQALWNSSFLIVQNFLSLVRDIGLGGVFMGFSICSFLGASYLYFYAVETKGKAKNEIISEMMRRGPFEGEKESAVNSDYIELKEDIFKK